MTMVLLWSLIVFTLGAAFFSPYALGLLYVWVDIFRPQSVATSGFGWISISFWVGAFAALGLIFSAPQKLFKLNIIFALQLMLAAWITYTTLNAVVQTSAWIKWDLAIKTILFSALLGHFTTKRVQVEALALSFVIAASAQIMSVGIKTFIGGGGYEHQLGIIIGNDQLAEGSMLAVYSASMIPFISYLSKNSILLPKTKMTKWVAFFSIGLCISACVGTFARAGLVSLLAIGMYFFFKSERKILMSISIAAALIIATPIISSTSWFERMSTIVDHTADNSAMGRIAMWSWAIDYVMANPLGGGFKIDEISQNKISAGGTLGEVVVSGKAFHSIYFEVLAEHGFLGFGIYFGSIAIILAKLLRIRQKFRHERTGWEYGFANMLFVSWCSFLLGCAFVNVAFMPYLFLMQALSISFISIASASSPSSKKLPSVNSSLRSSINYDR
jgi:putative inorganic carbon (hco3(-)) transporter